MEDQKGDGRISLTWVVRSELDETGSGSWLMQAFSVSGVEPWDFSPRDLLINVGTPFIRHTGLVR